MKSNKKCRITNSSLNDMTAMFFEQGCRKGHFNTIAHPPLGYGTKGCEDTEAECYETISFFTKVAKEEGSKVFILGFAPRFVSFLWIKTAEVIIRGSEVKTVLIPIAKIVSDGDSWNPTVVGGLLYITEEGISEIKSVGEMTVQDFWTKIAEEAMALNQKYSHE